MSDDDAPLLSERSQGAWHDGETYGFPRQMPSGYSRHLSLPLFLSICIVSIFGTMLFLLSLMTAVGRSNISAPIKVETSETIPDYFQTSPQVFAGPTKTAYMAPFLAQTNHVPYGAMSYAPNYPLETAMPIQGNINNSNIFEMMGHLSPNYPNVVGFGVGEYQLPPGANITHANLLHRHGSRYPTSGSSVLPFGSKIEEMTANGTANWSGPLSFLNSWKYKLGAEILVPRGRQELFDSGILHYYNYGHLYNTSTKIIARTTTQDRMLKSAEYFMAGFFGLEWTQNVTLEVIIEEIGFNNSLAGYFQCDNAINLRSSGGNRASAVWEAIYLQDATQRLAKYTKGYNWTTADAYNAQTLCPYETVAFGYSLFCDLFTFEEWQGFEYSIDLQFQGNAGFLSPTGRGVGIGYVEELYARLQNHLYDLSPGLTQVNITLDTMESTFPLDQNLYLDFSHDTNIYSVITAFGLEQFADKLPNNTIPADRNVTISHITPFAARMVWEVIKAPAPVKQSRPTDPNANLSDFYDSGDATTYLHLTISQRTVPLGKSWPSCGNRDDGWCEMNTALKVMSGLLEKARYEYSCFGNYTDAPYLEVTDGVPVTRRMLGGAMGTGLEVVGSSDRYVM